MLKSKGGDTWLCQIRKEKISDCVIELNECVKTEII